MIKQRNIFGGVDILSEEKKVKNKMNKQVRQVADFNEAFKLQINQECTEGDMEQCQLRYNLMEEELTEYWEAVNIARHQDKEVGQVAIADALTDMLYVLHGMFLYHGIAPIQDVLFTEVHASNMSKLDRDGKPIYREDGKVLKSEDYFKPKLKEIIENYKAGKYEK